MTGWMLWTMLGLTWISGWSCRVLYSYLRR